MKHTYIKYEKLSSEIKNEINEFHKASLLNDRAIAFHESVNQWFSLKFDEWLMKHYSKSNTGSRRKHFRLDVEIPIRVIETLIESSSDDTNAMEFVGKIVNISRGGLYFKYSRPIEISSIIKVVIDLKSIDAELDEVEALAMVVRAEEINDHKGIGIMFSSIYGADKEKLDLFILRNLSYYIYSEEYKINQ